MRNHLQKKKNKKNTLAKSRRLNNSVWINKINYKTNALRHCIQRDFILQLIYDLFSCQWPVKLLLVSCMRCYNSCYILFSASRNNTFQVLRMRCCQDHRNEQPDEQTQSSVPSCCVTIGLCFSSVVCEQNISALKCLWLEILLSMLVKAAVLHAAASTTESRLFGFALKDPSS